MGSETPCDDTDKLLFVAAATIQIGDGANAKFWDSAWLQGRRLKDIAPASLCDFQEEEHCSPTGRSCGPMAADLELPISEG